MNGENSYKREKDKKQWQAGFSLMKREDKKRKTEKRKIKTKIMAEKNMGNEKINHGKEEKGNVRTREEGMHQLQKTFNIWIKKMNEKIRSDIILIKKW